MQDLQSYLDTKLEADDEFVVPAHKSPEDLLDQFGLMASVMMLCIGLLIAALWVINSGVLRNVVRSKMLWNGTTAMTYCALGH